MSDTTWTTKDGKEIQIKNMTTQHIINALEVMRRKMIVLGKELSVRGELGGFSEKEVDAMFEKYVRERLRDLQEDMNP